MAADPARDEVMKKFSKNLRKLLDNRDHKPIHPPRGVRFNPETVDVSFGGTETSGQIKDFTIDGTKIDIDICVSKENKTNNYSSRGTSNGGCSIKNAKVSDNKSNTKCNSVVSEDISSQKRTTDKGAKECSGRDAVNHHENNVSHSANTPSRKNQFDNLRQSGVGTPECFKPVAFETPHSALKSKVKRNSCDDDMNITEDSSVTVAVRVRPLSAREIALGETKSCVAMCGNETLVTPEKGEVHRFTYDYSFCSFDDTSDEFANQEYVYESLAQPMLGKAFEGYNTCLFAYGQTGSGKSYSIMGHGSDEGVVPRFCEELFSRIDNNIEKSVLNVEISYFEIYNEKIHDLLGPYLKDKSGKKPNLKVREHPVLGPYVEGLSSYVIKSYEDVKGWLNVGNKHRATAATGMNDKSSRSHSVFTMVLTQTRTDNIEGEDHEHSITSKINLVDLAGSERQSVAKTSGERLREGASINKSLMTLGKVISLLAEHSSGTERMRKKKTFIPYRDSVLTWLLKESLGGNSKTAMLATISPALLHIEETLSTLRYANTARSIVNIAKVNEDPKARLIRELRGEIDKLRTATGVVSDDVISSSLAEITSLREKLLDKEREMDEMTKSWQDRLKKSEERRTEEARKLEKSGIALKIDNKMPNLVNLNEDPHLSEMLLYVLKVGKSLVGRMKEDSTHEIQLNGPLIADNHCVFENEGKSVIISPMGDAPTYVNGEIISEPTTLHHGDRVILGGDHYFRFNHPIEVQQGRKSGRFSSGGGTQLKDFEFARQELIQVQNARLEAELEEARKKHEEMLKEELERKEREAKMNMNIELEKVKQQSEMELSMQRHQYDGKLAELEQHLSKHRQQSAESDSHRKHAEDLVKKLAQQKLMLEQEVIANRKRLELEAKAAQKVVEESRKSHCKIVEQLEKEKMKIAKDVEQLRLKRQGTGNTPRLTPLPQNKTPLDREKTDFYRTTLLVREANKIAQHLKKDTVFTRENVVNGDTTETVVKVTNSKLNVGTFWTMEKFEDRLLQMKELYQSAGEEDSLDTVFYDPNDVWEKADRISDSPGISPRMLRSLKKQHMRSPMAVKLSFDDKPSPRTISRASTDSQSNSIMEKGFLGNVSIMSEAPTFEEPHETNNVPLVMTMCRDLISGSLERFKGQTVKESIADRVLHTCECVQAAVTNMLEHYNKHTEEPSLRGCTSLIDSEVMRVRSVQLTTCVELLLSHCSIWSGMYDGLSSSIIRELCSAILNATKKMASHVVFFLQGCENDIDSMVQESSSQIFESLFQLCRHCGELALATETPMLALRDILDESLSDDEKDTHIKVGEDIKQQFIGGCDKFIDKTVQVSLKTVEDSRIKVKSLEGDLRHSSTSGMTDDLLQQIETTTRTTKVLLQTLQQAQVELDTTVMGDSSDRKLDNYYHRNYIRSQQLITHLCNLADSVSLLVQTSEPIVLGKEDGSLRRVGRYAEMIQKTTSKILTASKLDCNSSRDNVELISSHMGNESVLTASQTERQDCAATAVDKVTRALVLSVKQKLGTDTLTTPNKVKRINAAGVSESPRCSRQ